MKKKLVLLQVIIASIFICTSVYAAISATLDLTVSKTTLVPGDTVRVTLSLSDISGSTSGITNISGYINYDKEVFETITKDNIIKESSGKVKVGDVEIPLYDLASGSSDECMLFNGNPASNNDARLLIDLNNNHALKSAAQIIALDFVVKQSASFKTVENAIRFTGFVLTADGQNLSELSKAITVTIKDPTPPPPPPDNTNTNSNTNNNTNNNTDSNTNRNRNTGTTNTNSNTNSNTNNNTNNNTNSNTNNNTDNNTNSNTDSNTNNNTNNNTNSNTNSNTNMNVKNNNTSNTNVNNTDNTLKAGSLPATGLKTIIIPISICMALAFISYNKYMKYKEF